jgi:hypothetical protein
MSERHSPSTDLSAPASPDAAQDRSIAAWLDLMRTCDKFLWTGLRADVGPEGDVYAAYKNWYEQWCDDHNRTVIRMLTRLERAECKSVDRSNHQDA